MKKLSNRKVFFILLAMLGILIVIFLGILWIQTEAQQDGSRSMTDCQHVQNITVQEIFDESVPASLVQEYRFVLDNELQGDTLVFYINHSNVEVNVADTCVYRMSALDGLMRTYGSAWITVPLYREDYGQEICVRLFPLYENYKNNIPNFMIGTTFSIYHMVFRQEISVILLCLCTMFVGLILFGAAVYCTLRIQNIFRLYAVSSLALTVGIWRFTYGRLVYLLWFNHTRLIYVISVISLMGAALSLLFCADSGENPKLSKKIRMLSYVYCMIYILQLIFQLWGILDLRQMLCATHVTILLSAVFCFIVPLYADKPFRKNYIWLLGTGAIVDLLFYYFVGIASGMFILLVVLLVFVISEGIQMLKHYSKQKETLTELKTQIKLNQSMILMSQIRSHFVFNILNAISGMCKYNPEKADETIVRFARYLRNNISIMENDENLLFSTVLNRLEDYVILEQVRFGDKLEFYTEIETDQFMIPSLILQPIVENAIKHGISKKQSKGTIILRTYDMGESVVITVEDDGVGFEPDELEKKNSVGLKNIRFRLKYLVNGTLDITSEPDKGTLVTITIPKDGGVQCEYNLCR